LSHIDKFIYDANDQFFSANAGDGSPASGAGEAACGRTKSAAGKDSRTLSGPGIG